MFNKDVSLLYKNHTGYPCTSLCFAATLCISSEACMQWLL